MNYQWKKASYIKVDANVAGQVCEELTNTVGLTAETLLEASRDEGAPLHKEFEWDDSLAAEQYRMQQARHIINCLCIKVEDKTEEPVRAFFTIVESEYEPINVIMSVEDKRQALLNSALRELEAFERKYQTLTELAEVFKAIKKTRKKKGTKHETY